MLMIKRGISLFLLCVVLSGFSSCLVEGAQFISPSKKQLDVQPLAEIKKAYGIRKIPFPTNINLEALAKQEKAGFIGYHGDSLDFLIYQDIIRFVLETIVEVPMNDDFHFLAVPLDPSLTIQTKEDLSQVFNNMTNPVLDLYDTTFPLNFSIWDNANRLGLNSVEHLAKNESVKPLGYRKRLKWLFKELGIEETQIEKLFTEAHKKLKPTGNTGVLLQIFDNSENTYTFAKKIAYPAYPNGYIAENRTVDEIFLDEGFAPPYPHEVRLLLNNKETLNPKSPLKVVRYVPSVSSENRKSYESRLKSLIEKISHDKKAAADYRAKLQEAWGSKF